MNNVFKNGKAWLFRCLATIIAIIVVCSAGCYVFADEATTADASVETAQNEVPQAVTDLINLISKLPTDTDMLTLDDKDAVWEAQKAYTALSEDDKLLVDIAYIGVLNSDYSAMSVMALREVTNQIKELPKPEKIKDSNKKTVMSIYDDYKMLNDLSRESMNEDYRDQLLLSVYKLDSSVLSEEDIELIRDKAAKLDERENGSGNDMSVWEYAFIAVLAVLVLAVITMEVIITIKGRLFKFNKNNTI